jgi:phosphoglycerol transferase MdoB-like AlkP superfamily enzyme
LSILAAFPALPRASAINQPHKYRQLPSLIKSLTQEGYTVEYYYGGQSTYGNIKGFVYDNGADDVIDEDDLSSRLPRGRLGIHDPYMYQYIAAELPSKKKPHCTIFFTVSTHSPYDIPTATNLVYSGPEEPYARAVYYADSALGRFIQTIKHNGEYDKSLVVMIPDHSHASVIPHHMLSPERYRIGMLFAGGVLKDAYRGQKVLKMASQLDFAKTLLMQLGMDASQFHWSKNILDPQSPAFASYVYPGGTGWIRPQGSFVWDYAHDAFYLENFPVLEERGRLVTQGKAYLQLAFQKYMDL